MGRESWQGPCLISDQDPDVKAHLPSLILAKCVNPDPYKGVLEGEVLAFKYSFNTSSVGRGTSSGFWTYPIDGKTPPDIRLQYDNQDDWEILGVHEGKLEGPQPANLPDRPHVLAIKDHPTFFLPLRYFPTCGAYIYAGETGPEFCFDYRVVYTDSLLVEFPVTGKRSVFVWSSNEKAFVGPGGNWLNQYSEYRILGVHAVRDSTSKVEAGETAAPPPEEPSNPPLRLVRSRGSRKTWYLVVGFDEGTKTWKGKGHWGTVYDFPEANSEVLQPGRVTLERTGPTTPRVKRSSKYEAVVVEAHYFYVKEKNLHVRVDALGWRIVAAEAAKDESARKTEAMSERKIGLLRKELKQRFHPLAYGSRIVAPAFEQKALPTLLSQKEKERQYFVGLHWADALLSLGVLPTVALPQEPPPQLGLYSQFQFRLNHSTQTNRKEEPNMSTLKIETVTQINGVNSSNFTPEQLLEMIRVQKRAISDLEALEVSSVKVTNRITEHLENVRKLVDILDGRDPAAEQEQPK